MAQTIIVDTTPGYRMPTIYYSQGDIGRTFSIDLQSRFGESLPASPTITIQATKPSGLGFSVGSTSVSGAVVTFTVTETMSNEAGRFPAELKIVKNSVTLFTANFYIDCEANAHPEGTTDGDIDHIMPKFMSVTTTTLPAGDSATYSFDANTNTATFGIPKGADGSLASQVLAADYSSSKTYAVGDYVYYSGNLYRCTTAITTAEAWTSGHWTQVALANDVTDLKSAFNSAMDNDSVIINKPITWQQGFVSETYEGVILGSSLSGFTLVELNAGETVVIGTGSSKIGVISSTTADSVSVGDTVNIIYASGDTSEFKTYSYTAHSTIKLVLSVLLSNYELVFLRKSNAAINAAIEADRYKTLNKFPNKNLIGMADRKYPVIIPTGTTLTMSTADGQPIGANNLRLLFYDADGNEFPGGGWAFISDQSKRTITVNNGGQTAYFVGWSCPPAKNVQLELGATATNYVAYEEPEYVKNNRIAEAIYSERGIKLPIVDWKIGNAYADSYGNLDFSDAASRCRCCIAKGDLRFDTIKAKEGYEFFLTVCERNVNNGLYSVVYTHSQWTARADISSVSGKYYVWVAVRKTDNSDFSSASEAANNIAFFKNNPADSVYCLNSDRFPKIASLCRTQDRISFATKKYFVFAHITDTHAVNKAVSRAVQCLNDCPDIDMLLHTGDIQRKSYYDEKVDTLPSFKKENNIQDYIEIVKSSIKPVLSVLGNHDQNGCSGNTITLKMLYDRFMKPMVDKGWLVSGTNIDSSEYATYYYKDFPSYNIRFIGLNSFDPLYDDFYTNKNMDDNVIKYSPAQISFLINTLQSTPSDYCVVIGTHYACNGYTNAVVVNSDWSTTRRNEEGAVSRSHPILLDGDPAMDILAAYKAKTSLTKTYTYSDSDVASALGDIDVDVDFSSANGELVFIPIGHAHDDWVANFPLHEDIKAVSIAGSILTEPDSDLGRGYTGVSNEWRRQILELESKMVGKPQDAINVYIVRPDIRKVYIVRLGADFTVDARDRIITSISF